MIVQRTFIIVLFVLIQFSCDSGGEESSDDNFDRQEMLIHWADNIIIPAYENYDLRVSELNILADAFVTTPNLDNLMTLRQAWKSAYLAWQWVAMFEIGPAETIGLQGYTNTYPVASEEIESSIAAGNYNLELPSRRNQQGQSALDYMINGLSGSDEEIVARYTSDITGDAYRTYLTDVTSRLDVNISEVLADWESSYRETFVNNDGSSATGAVNKITNDYIFYFEKHLRAGKIGIPAGVFSGKPDATDVEGYYASDFSKELFLEALAASKAFFNGHHFGSSQPGPGFKSYLDYLNTITEGPDLAMAINDQFGVIETTADLLSASFSDQVLDDNTLMLNTYDALQDNVINFKIDMLQSLNIKVDYVDADGD